MDAHALQGLTKTISNAPLYGEDWVNLADVGHYLNKISPDLTPRNYGYNRLREFAGAAEFVEMKYKNMGEKPPLALVRLRLPRI